MLTVSVLLAAAAGAQAAPSAARRAKLPKSKDKPAAAVVEPVLEPKAIDILKTASARLAAARSLAFTAVISYESPSLPGPPLVYTTRSEVTLQRPDKLRVITSGDGPPSEFYYDGKTIMAFSPADNLVAVAEAPPTIDAALQAAYESAAIYFPFTDVIVTDPYGDIADGLKLAYYIGKTDVVGGTVTDMVAYASDHVFVKISIVAESKKKKMLSAVYRHDPSQLRHQMELSNWQLDSAVPADAFSSANATSATRIEFARPDPKLPPGGTAPAKRESSKSRKPSGTK